MNRTYTEAGKQYTDTEAQKAILQKGINSVQWFDLPAKNLPFSQGEGLRVMIKQVGNKPDKIGYGIVSVTHGVRSLLAIRCNYTSGEVKRATVYGIDNGHELVIVAVDTETNPQ
jgi:hypothetical protein